jgi:redox-sensing transcriptional repressor
MDELPTLRPRERPAIGVITTPGWAAQQVAELLVRAGVTSLLNFAPRVLNVPSDVHLRYVDLSIELQVLGFYRARQEDIERGVAAGDGRTPPLIRSVGMSPGSELG